MSYEPNQILGTFLPDGSRLTGIICTSSFQGRMVFTPSGGEDGRLIASINGRNVGFAEQVSAGGETPRYAVLRRRRGLRQPGPQGCASIGTFTRFRPKFHEMQYMRLAKKPAPVYAMNKSQS